VATKEPIKDWQGKILGFIETESNDNKVLRDFYGCIRKVRQVTGRDA